MATACAFSLDLGVSCFIISRIRMRSVMFVITHALSAPPTESLLTAMQLRHWLYKTEMHIHINSICMYVYLYIYIYIYRIRTHAYICIYIYIYACLSMFLHSTESPVTSWGHLRAAYGTSHWWLREAPVQAEGHEAQR